MAWDKASIVVILENPTGKNYIVWRMLQAMLQRQTADEQIAESTNQTNNKGFNSSDAPLLTNIAKNSKPYKNLTDKQTAMVARKLRKYAGQLAKVAEEKLQPKM